MVANDELANREYNLGYLQQLDKAALAPAFERLTPLASQGDDRDHAYSIPWQGGMTGLIVNARAGASHNLRQRHLRPEIQGQNRGGHGTSRGCAAGDEGRGDRSRDRFRAGLAGHD